MSHRANFLSLIALIFCAMLPMSPVMSAAMYNLAPGYTAEFHESSSPAEFPLRSLESERWDLLQIKAPDAWTLAGDGQAIIVAVLDSGIDQSHPSLEGKVIDSVNFSGSPNIDTNRGHGTHIAGVIAAALDQTGNSGLAYNARLLDVQVADNHGRTDALKVANGIIWAVDHGARVINTSLVISQPYRPLEDAVNYAWEKDCVIVAAAGNNGLSNPVYPAAYPHVISVAASDKSDKVPEWSGHGKWVDVSAPGVEILSTLPGNRYGKRSGSSFSTALVSGEAALLYAGAVDQDENGRVNREVEDMILNNCDQIEGLQNPNRRINVYNAAIAADIISEMLARDDSSNIP